MARIRGKRDIVWVLDPNCRHRRHCAFVVYPHIYILYTLSIYIFGKRARVNREPLIFPPKRRRPLICFSRYRRPWVEGRGERQVSK